MFKKIIFSIFILFCFLQNANSQIPLTVKRKSIDSLYYQNKTKWITLTPFFITKQEFSPDHGNTWEKVGMFGGNVRPYLVSDSIATQNIKLYKYTRIAGIVQMWVIAPLLAYKHFTYEPKSQTDPDATSINDLANEEEQGGYLTASIIIFFTGSLTYHVLSKTFLYRSLHDFNRGILDNEFFENTSFKFDVKLDYTSQTPQLALTISF